jgi:putative membrane protein
LDAQQDARKAIGADWSPRHIVTRRAPRGSVAYAAAGLAIILTSWLLLSVLVSVVRFFDMSISLGSVALALCVAGSALVTYAGAREWRPLRNLHEVDALRAIFGNAAGDLDASRKLCRVWLERIAPRLPEAGGVAAALGEVRDVAQLRALARNRLAAPLDAATYRIGINAATDAGALVTLSPHASLDGVIVAVRGIRVIHQVALLYGLRPRPAVTIALLGRVARAAVETAVTDLMSQAIADVVGSVPIIKQPAAVPGAGVAGFRLYPLARITAKALDGNLCLVRGTHVNEQDVVLIRTAST